jgi:alanine-synthesizing transaminase
VRFSLIENEHRTRQAVRSIREMFRKDRVSLDARQAKN